MNRRFVALLYFLTFAPAAVEKLIAFETPTWFLKQFEPTVLGIFPALLPIQFFAIAIAEFVIAILFLVILVRKNSGKLMDVAMPLAFLCFVTLGFGQRLSHKYEGAAELFFYAGITFLLACALGTTEKETT